MEEKERVKELIRQVLEDLAEIGILRFEGDKAYLTFKAIVEILGSVPVFVRYAHSRGKLPTFERDLKGDPENTALAILTTHFLARLSDKRKKLGLPNWYAFPLDYAKAVASVAKALLDKISDLRDGILAMAEAEVIRLKEPL